MTIKNISHKLTVHPQKEYAQRSLDVIDKIIVHHSATSGGTPESFADYHVKRKDWPGIGYHCVIDKDGMAYLTNTATTVSYNCSGQNMVSIGVCLIGDYSEELPNEQMLNSLTNVINYYRELTKKELPVYGHRHFRKTQCPGKRLDDFLHQSFSQEKTN